ncbi:MAG: Type 1 glutamine amidotransferase-like domain-containing protein [Clostridia bacterium]|nr:Type 1 glutamine amidotransferase-like domain-containing protein [Clostridia bacterium]
MNKVILTSCIDLYSKDENGNRVAHHFGNKNGILDTLKSCIKKYDNFLFVASVEDKPLATDMYASVTFKSFDITLPFKNYQVLDGRTKDHAKELIKNADFIFLCGGHVPTQNKFFHNINLPKLILEAKAPICGGSAGSMNCAKTVYCPPELEGEALDPNFNIFLEGLGLVDFNILPHYNSYFGETLDGKRIIEDITLPDSYKTDIYCISDGGYFVADKNGVTMNGETFVIKNGVTTKLCDDNESKPLIFDKSTTKNNRVL